MSPRELLAQSDRDNSDMAVALRNALPALIAYVEASEALKAIISTEDVYSGLSPREFVRVRVCGITIGTEADAAWESFHSARTALEQALGGER